MTTSAALDTNVLICAHISDYPDHAKVSRWVSRFMTECDLFYLSWQIVYEYIRVVTHPRVLKRPLMVKQAVADLKVYLEDERCRLLVETPEHPLTLDDVIGELPSSKGNFIHDCHYAALLKEHSIRTLVTMDADFRKFGFLTVVNPAL